MREEIEVLEHHAHLLTILVEIDLLVHDILILEDDASVGRRLEKVQTPEEGGLTGTGWSDHDHDVAPVNIDVDAIEGLDLSVVIVHFQATDLNHWLIGCHFDASSSRCTR